MGRGNGSLFRASGLHDQDGRHTHIYNGKNPSKKIFFRTGVPIVTKLGMYHWESFPIDFDKTFYVALGTPPHQSLFK